MSRPEFDLLRETLEHLPAGLMLFRSVRDSGGSIIDFEWLFASEVAATLVGRSDADLRGERLLEQLPGHLDDGVFDSCVRAVETGEPSETELRYPRDAVAGRLAARVVKLDDGCSIMFADPSEPRGLARSPKDRWELVQDLFMQAPFAIAVVHGPAHTFLLANPEYERMIDRHGLVGRTVREVFPELPADTPVVRVLDEVRASGTPFSAREFEVALRSGDAVEPRYFQFTYSPVREDAKGCNAAGSAGTTAIQIVAVDVSDQVRCRQRTEAMTEALELNERRFKATFENAAVGIAHLSPQGKWLRFNQRVAQLLGYARKELRELSYQEVSHPEDLAPDVALAESLLRGEIRSYQLEKRYVRKDGATIWVNLTVSLVRDEAERPLFFVAVIEDIGERKAAEDALRVADRQKDEFLAMLSHELRNPLAAIRSACALLETIDSPNPLMSRIQDVLSRQTSHMAHLLDELLDLARVTNAKLTIVTSVLDLGVVIREGLADLDIPHHSPSLTFELPDEPVWVHGDRVRLEQVVHNLLSNAIKYTPTDGRVVLRLTVDNGVAILSVADTGVGFDREFGERLFKPFQQAPQDIARSAGGLGLGLALAKTIVELHDGTIHARSPGRGQGSVFEVRLPLTTAIHPKQSEPTVPVSSTARVIIVEDNEDAAELLAALLRSRDFNVELASRGEQALAMVREWRPHAVICDIGLPDIDGYTVARTIRADPELADVKLVALSGYGQAKDRVRAAEAGFDTHLTKPAAIDAVIRAITDPRGRPALSRSGTGEAGPRD